MSPSSSPGDAPRSAPALTTLPWPAVAILLLTAVLSLLWSHFKLMTQDEFFVLQTDSVPTLAQLIHIQRSYPISLDPLLFHALAHAAIRLVGPGAFAIRLPSLAGYLLMQVCLYLFVRRFAAKRTALFAMAFPALTATLFYSAEGRPYGLLLGLYGLAMLSWQTATRRESSHTAALLTLTLAIALTLNTHYFGVLLLLPLCSAELYRTIERRRFDLPLLSAIVVGMAAIVFALPFERAAGEFRTNYYNGGQVGLRAITQSYRALFVDYTGATLRVQHLAAIAFLVLAAALIYGCVRQLRLNDLRPPNHELVFLLGLAALPCFGFLIARFVTHTIEVRYVLGAILALSVFAAIALTPLLRRAGALLVPLLVTAIVIAGIFRIYPEQQKRRNILAALQLSPTIRAALLASPTGLLYVQDMGVFDTASYYEPDPGIRSRITLVYSARQELLWDKHDTASLTADHMRHFTAFRIVPYRDLRGEQGAHLFVLKHDGWNWTDQAFAAAHATVTPLGPAMLGDAASVHLAPQR